MNIAKIGMYSHTLKLNLEYLTNQDKFWVPRVFVLGGSTVICCHLFQALREPRLTECCGQNYCGSCISHWLHSHPTCPHCRGTDFTHIRDKKLERKVRELKVKCINSDSGCEWENCLSELDKHLTSKCLYVVQDCPNRCGVTLTKQELKHHLEATCRLREVECEYCQYSSDYESIVTEHIRECLEYPVSCENKCGRILKRKDMQNHCENECPNVLVECPFSDYGCKSLPVSRKVLQSHITLCQNQHVVDALEQLKGETRSLRAEIKGLQEESKVMRNMLHETQENLKAAQHDIQSMKVESEHTSKTLMTELEYFHQIQDMAQVLALECIKTQLASVCSGGVYLTTSGKPATFRITSFSMHKESGLVWHSPPFYIFNGYKMCLAIHTNGIGAGKGTHMSIYLHQMASKKDHQLQWPFFPSDDLEVRLIRQVEISKHHSTSKSLPRHASDQDCLKAKSSRFSPFNTRRPLPTCPLSPDNGESQCMRLDTYLHQVPGNVGVGPSCGKLELFCLQKTVNDMVYQDSVVFQCQLNSKSAGMSSTLKNIGQTL